MDTNSVAIGSVVPTSVEGAQVPLRIVAEVTSFPTVTAPGGALITDLGSLSGVPGKAGPFPRCRSPSGGWPPRARASPGP